MLNKYVIQASGQNLGDAEWQDLQCQFVDDDKNNDPTIYPWSWGKLFDSPIQPRKIGMGYMMYTKITAIPLFQYYVIKLKAIKFCLLILIINVKNFIYYWENRKSKASCF